ncbi:MAG: type I DNA topoisomerase [Candidatus Dojkabacteria bacterium]|nr:type I DNA topoisomerase [Candidatus Dojkabacteria bacterium]
MHNYLVIVESPSKAKTIAKYLGKNYIVVSSKGHLVDLPKSKLGIYPEDDFKAEFVVTNKKQLDEIYKMYDKCDEIILALDLDREGEAIAWHIINQLNNLHKTLKPYKRITFSEISKQALINALNNPRDININLVNAQLARRFLDRLVGYTLSPLLWKKIFFGLSAGRVQSVALRLIVAKERSIRSFVPTEYWQVYTTISDKFEQNIQINNLISQPNKDFKYDSDQSLIDDTDSSDSYSEIQHTTQNKDVNYENLFILTKINNKYINQTLNEEKVKDIVSKVTSKSSVWKISKIEKKDTLRYPKSPFITSTLQQFCNVHLGLSASKTMQIAQKLYENGYITYMRTDSVNISDIFMSHLKEHISSKFGKEYLPNVEYKYKTSTKVAQEAHECIRPVDINKSSSDLKLENYYKKVYDAIYNRTVMSQMAPAVIIDTTYEITVITDDGNQLIFKNKKSKLKFDGWLILDPTSKNLYSTDADKYEKYSLDQVVYPNAIYLKQSFTSPPSRYSEATLIKKMEEMGIGRPSTYASIIQTIISRKYISLNNKQLVPTDTGEIVNEFLEKYFEDIVDYDFTARMEENLDMIAHGKMEWKKLLSDFYFPFKQKVENIDKSVQKSDLIIIGDTNVECPVCKQNMIVKIGRYGKFLSCKNYPKCNGLLPYEYLSNNSENIETKSKSKNQNQINIHMFEKPPVTDDGREYLLKKGRFGYFWSHPDYPKVKDAKPAMYNKEYILINFGTPPLTEDGREYSLKKGKFGYFWAHPDYPNNTDIVKINKKNVN